MLIIFSLLSTSLFASEIKDYCLKEITSVWKVSAESGLEAQFYRDIFMKESDSFCGCIDKVFSSQEKILGINPYFLDASARFTQEDYCRHEHYKEGTFEISTLLALKQLQVIIQERIQNRYFRGLWRMASEDSITKKFLCLEQKINNKCLKTGSGSVSYHCVIQTTTSGKQMYELDNECPEFESLNFSSPVI